jgi:hypothetical protein
MSKTRLVEQKKKSDVMKNGDIFINFTMVDRDSILSGVAPSGSSKRKVMRETGVTKNEEGYNEKRKVRVRSRSRSRIKNTKD